MARSATWRPLVIGIVGDMTARLPQGWLRQTIGPGVWATRGAVGWPVGEVCDIHVVVLAKPQLTAVRSSVPKEKQYSLQSSSRAYLSLLQHYLLDIGFERQALMIHTLTSIWTLPDLPPTFRRPLNFRSPVQ